MLLLLRLTDAGDRESAAGNDIMGKGKKAGHYRQTGRRCSWPESRRPWAAVRALVISRAVRIFVWRAWVAGFNAGRARL